MHGVAIVMANCLISVTQNIAHTAVSTRLRASAPPAAQNSGRAGHSALPAVASAESRSTSPVKLNPKSVHACIVNVIRMS